MEVSNRRIWTLVALTAALIVGAMGAWFAVATDGAHTPTATIDERARLSRRSLRSVERDVIRALGQPDRDPGFAPAGENPSEVGVPESVPAIGPGDY
jgi:hypothetical protein